MKLTVDVLNREIEDRRCRSMVDVCAAGLRVAGLRVPDNAPAVVRAAFSTAAVAEVFTQRIGSQILAAYDQEPDSTEGWVREISARNFLSFDIVGIDVGARLERLRRGQTAASATLGTQGEQLAVSRFAASLTLDEREILDGALVGFVDAAADEIGRAARRCRLDLVYSLLLANPTLADDATALFHGDHNNLGAVTLTEPNLDAGFNAVHSQRLRDGASGERTHINLSPRFLVVAPALATVARRAARNLSLDDGADLAVCVESRLSSAGVVDPRDNALRSGWDTGWLLAAPQSQRAGIVVAGLDGDLTPKIRDYEINQPGEWGRVIDITLDIGAGVLDYRPLYLSHS